jgi:hypothetical protein
MSACVKNGFRSVVTWQIAPYPMIGITREADLMYQTWQIRWRASLAELIVLPSRTVC